MKGADDGESYRVERKARRTRVAGTTGVSRAAAIGARWPPAPCQWRMQRNTAWWRPAPGNTRVGNEAGIILRDFMNCPG